MRKIVFNIIFIAAITFFLFPCIGFSRVVTFEFTAEVTDVCDVANILVDEINVGDSISGTYTYDTTGYLPQRHPGIYDFNSPPAGISANINNFEFESDPNNTDMSIFVENNTDYIAAPPMDHLDIRSNQNLIFHNDELNSEIGSSSIVIELWAPARVNSNLYEPALLNLPVLINSNLPVNTINLTDCGIRTINIWASIKSEQQTTNTFSIGGMLKSITLVSKPPKIIYVDDNAADLNNGSSWENAYTFLQDAITDANNSDKPVEIRIAQGTYKPDMGTEIIAGDREATFNLMNQVAIKGGYAGLSGPNHDVQNHQLYKTILTGDLNGDDILGFSNRNDNSYHVLSAIDTDESTYIEGLFITGGNADGLPANTTDPLQRRDDHTIRGGGLYAHNSHFYHIKNCTFKDNYSYSYGGEIYLYGSARILNCNFSGNKAELSGGALHFGISGFFSGDIYLRGCVLQGNTSVSDTYLYTGQTTFYNCTFDDTPIENKSFESFNCITKSDALFAAPGHWNDNSTPEDANDDYWIEGDYHLKSQAGRWNPNTQSWVQDDVTSPYIDAGAQDSLIGSEPFPNGGRINSGAYGGTNEASKSYESER